MRPMQLMERIADALDALAGRGRAAPPHRPARVRPLRIGRPPAPPTYRLGLDAEGRGVLTCMLCNGQQLQAARPTADDFYCGQCGTQHQPPEGSP
jgi:hypothetical protein